MPTVSFSVSMPEDVLRDAKRAAKRQRPPCSLSALITLAVRDLLIAQNAPKVKA